MSGVLAAAWLTLASPAAAQDPLSAIDWLSQSVNAPRAGPAVLQPQTGRPASGVDAAPISVVAIDAPRPDAVGLLPVAVTGLPRGVWGPGRTEEIAALIGAVRPGGLPAVQGLIYTLLLAEVDPPGDADTTGRLLLARVDKLVDLGALDAAMALLDLAGTKTPEPFRRWFDVALLLGEEDRACDTMRALPGVAPTFAARVYCLARGGDWGAAALTLRTARALGLMTDTEDALLSRFLDPELYEGEPPLPLPDRPSPLVWRIHEAIGEPIATNGLPVAFAQADLRANTGWKARIEAAERLARTGSVPANRLLGLYTERKPAASGGVWDRAAAIQALDAALSGTDPAALGTALPRAYQAMAAVELEGTFAAAYAETLGKRVLTGPVGALAFRVAMLSDRYETFARTRVPDGSDEAFLIGLARGDTRGTTPPDGLGAAIRDGFADPPLPADLAELVAQKRLGEAMLLAAARIERGAFGDLRDVTAGLATLRELGLEDVSRRAALELMLLERRG